MEEFIYFFLPLEIKVSFFKTQKCIFSQLILRNGTLKVTFSVNVWRLWQTNMWRNVAMRNFNLNNGTQELSSKEPSWLQLAMHLAVRTLAKISQYWVFHRINAANAQSKWQRLMQNIHRAVPLQKHENFFACSNHFGKKLLLTRP